VAGARLGLDLGLGVCVVVVPMQELLRFAHSGIVETRRRVDVLRCGVSDECPRIPVIPLPLWGLARTTKLWGIPPLCLSSIEDSGGRQLKPGVVMKKLGSPAVCL
jgi:hypothetical protein